MDKLNLSTTVTRDTIAIDGVEYEVRNTGELAYKEVAWFQWSAKRIDSLIKKLNDEYIESEAEELEKLMDKGVNLALVNIPAEVLKKLSDTQKVQIIEYFSQAADGPGRLNQNEQSPGSSASTGEQQESGSTPTTG